MGPAGGALAITNISNSIFLIAIQSVRNSEWIRLFELIGVLIAILGCLVLSIPEKFQLLYDKIRGKRNKVTSVPI